MTDGKNPIYIWVNEERNEQLKELGLDKYTEERLAGMKVLTVYANDEEANRLVKEFGAKHDTSTTGSIELVPPHVKDKIYEKVVEKKNLEVVSDALQEV